MNGDVSSAQRPFTATFYEVTQHRTPLAQVALNRGTVDRYRKIPKSTTSSDGTPTPAVVSVTPTFPSQPWFGVSSATSTTCCKQLAVVVVVVVAYDGQKNSKFAHHQRVRQALPAHTTPVKLVPSESTVTSTTTPLRWIHVLVTDDDDEPKVDRAKRVRAKQNNKQ